MDRKVVDLEKLIILLREKGTDTSELEARMDRIIEKRKAPATTNSESKPVIHWRKVYEANGMDMEIYKRINSGELTDIAALKAELEK